MNKKVMLISMLSLLLLPIPAAMAVDVRVEGVGTYSQTRRFGEVTDTVTLTGEWVFESKWEDGLHPYITNTVTLFEGSTYYEFITYPVNGSGFVVLIVIKYGVPMIHDAADIQVRGYAFAETFQDGGYRSVPEGEIPGETGYNRKNIR